MARMSADVARHEDPTVHAFMAADAPAQVQILRGWGMADAVTLILNNACENRCFFCANAGVTSVPRSELTPWDRIARHLDGRPQGVTTLLIGGNEPALHPDFERALAHAHAVGFTHIELMTSGLQLSAEQVTRWTAWGLAVVAVPIYAAQAALHDAVCGTRCFDRLVAGLDRAHAAGVRVELHTLALKRTVHDMVALADMARDRWSARLAIAPLRDKASLFSYAAESLSPDELAALLNAMPPHVSLVGMPACVDPARARGSAQVMDIYFRTQLRQYAPVCGGCAAQARCPGVVAARLATWGEAGLQPLPIQS